jgi:hypothetical protein
VSAEEEYKEMVEREREREREREKRETIQGNKCSLNKYFC